MEPSGRERRTGRREERKERTPAANKEEMERGNGGERGLSIEKETIHL